MQFAYDRILCIILLYFLSGCQSSALENKSTCLIKIIPQNSGMRKLFDGISQYEKEIDSFIKNTGSGILIYTRHDGFKNGKLLTVCKQADRWIASKVIGSTMANVVVSESNEVKLNALFPKVIVENYYQTCQFASSDSDLFYIVLKHEGEIKVEYFSPFASPFDVGKSTNNFLIFKEIVGNVFRIFI